MIELNDERLERYSRNILLKEVGIEGQEKLFRGRVLIIGAGGLGAPAALYLAAAGVGTIGIADADNVDLSNLQRQIIHFTSDVKRRKVDSAAEKMRAMNPDVTVTPHFGYVSAATVVGLLDGYDFVIDGTDNFASKFLINDACVMARVPYSHAGILRFDGQTLTVLPGQSACYRCVFRDLPPSNLVPTCSQAGIIGAVAGIVGTMQALEAIKFLLGVGTLLADQLLVYNALESGFRKVRVRRDPRCPVCGDAPTITELKDEEQPVCDLNKRGASC